MPYFDYECEDDALDQEDLTLDYDYDAASVIALLDEDDDTIPSDEEIAEGYAIALETQRQLVTA